MGEQVNINKKTGVHKWRLPFVGTDGCARWLAERLDEERIPEHRLYWVNAKRPDGSLTRVGFLQKLRPKRIITLGNTAKLWAQLNKLHHAIHVPHPSYWKRFHHHDRYPLLDVLLG